jgi:hypothetical protein
MTSDTNNNSNQSKTVAQLYEVFLYKKKDIIVIQKNLGISNNAQMTIHQSKKAKTLADSYKLLLDLIKDLILIQENFNIDGNPILKVELRSNKTHEASSDISLEEIYNLLLFLEDDIVAIQDKLGIVGYTNQEIVEETDKNTKEYLQKFEKFHSFLEDGLDVVLEKFGKVEVKKIWFTGEGFPLFLKVFPQQLHEVFVKNLTGMNYRCCPNPK